MQLMRFTSWSQITTGATGTFLTSTEMSASGQIIWVTGQNFIYYSENYGTTWTNLNGVAGMAGWWGQMAMSASGQYVYQGGGGHLSRLVYSHNFGKPGSWVMDNNVSLHEGTGIYTSATGQYVIAPQQTGQNFHYSSDYGLTWSVINKLVTHAGQSRCISGSGQYVYSFQCVGVLGQQPYNIIRAVASVKGFTGTNTLDGYLSLRDNISGNNNNFDRH